MLILHLSDIHFRSADVASRFDPNANLRADLLQDVSEQLALRPDQKPVAIIVSGDIAFAGKADEYHFARSWFEELCRTCCIGYEQLFFVPGNHDVDRAVASGPVVEALHGTIRHAPDSELTDNLRRLLEDDAAGQTLHSPISSYNDFTVGLDCAFSAPDCTTVRRDLKFPDGSSLNIWGFNSSLFCGGQLDRRGNLVIDPAYPQMRKSPGVVNLAVFHHPTSWLRNDIEFKAHLDQHAQLHLFGHEHSNTVDLGSACVRLSASAVHPEQNSGTYEPGYNIIDLNIVRSDQQRKLQISVEVREYQNRPSRFRAKISEEGTDFSTLITLQDWEPLPEPCTSAAHQTKSDTELSMVDPMINFRELSLEYFSLPLSSRYRIAEDLALIDSEDNDQPDFVRCRRMLLRAKERDQLNELSDSVKRFKQ